MALELIKLDSATLPGIADAIRAKSGGTGLLLPSEMAAAVRAIPTSGSGDSQQNAAMILSDFDQNGFPTSVRFTKDAFDAGVTKKLGAYGASNYLSYVKDIICDPTIDTLGDYSLSGITEPPDGFSRLDCYDSLKVVTRSSGLTIRTVAKKGYFPPNIEEIGFSAIGYGLNKSNLVSPVHIPASVKRITGAFTYKNFPDTIIFDGTPDSISMIGNSNTDVKFIKVPWAEGTIDGAPWGCPDATIEYNYVPEEEQ